MTRFLLLSLFAAGMTLAAPVSFLVNLNITGLMGAGSPPAPFSLVLDLLDNDGIAGNNTVLISSFSLGGGSLTGSPVTLGGVSGTLASGLTLTDSATYSHTFDPGTNLSFLVSANNAYAGDPFFNDSFTLYLLADGGEIPTEGLGFLGVNAVFGLDFNGGAPPVYAFASTDAATPFDAPEVLDASTPEPGTLALAGAALTLIAVGTRRALLVRVP